MRVFVLGTGRCGTMTFSKACGHITNYTSGHETHRLHPERFPHYPDNHIEVDAHLAWMLGDLALLPIAHRDGQVRFFSLYRNIEDTAKSFLPRPNARALATAIFQLHRECTIEDMRRLVQLIAQNINYFLSKQKTMRFVMRGWINEAYKWWPEFWDWIGAEGDMEAGRAEFKIRYNARRR